jgi:hypothetical protein
MLNIPFEKVEFINQGASFKVSHVPGGYHYYELFLKRTRKPKQEEFRTRKQGKSMVLEHTPDEWDEECIIQRRTEVKVFRNDRDYLHINTEDRQHPFLLDKGKENKSWAFRYQI